MNMKTIYFAFTLFLLMAVSSCGKNEERLDYSVTDSSDQSEENSSIDNEKIISRERDIIILTSGLKSGILPVLQVILQT